MGSRMEARIHWMLYPSHIQCLTTTGWTLAGMRLSTLRTVLLLVSNAPARVNAEFRIAVFALDSRDAIILLQEAHNMLEEVYRVAPVPEDYMKYQLHMSTGMEVPQIEQWFQHRRSNDGSSQRPMEGVECIASILMLVADTHADLFMHWAHLQHAVILTAY